MYHKVTYECALTWGLHTYKYANTSAPVTSLCLSVFVVFSYTECTSNKTKLIHNRFILFNVYFLFFSIFRSLTGALYVRNIKGVHIAAEKRNCEISKQILSLYFFRAWKLNIQKVFALGWWKIVQHQHKGKPHTQEKSRSGAISVEDAIIIIRGLKLVTVWLVIV